jgi:2,4-dienoyl-CoA reductase (NADPH2)
VPATPEAPYPHLARPGRIGSLELPHRILMGAMHLGWEGDPAQAPRLAAFYAARAAGGAALITTGGVAVNREGSGWGYARADRLEDHGTLRRVVEAVHAHGGRVAMQLFHHGRYGRSEETGCTPVAPSPLAPRIHPEVPRAMTEEDIWRTVGDFARGAALARDLGFDAVEVMGSEGYLLDEFVSPLTNRREDAWGGSPERRRRLPVEVVRAVRAAVGPDFPVIYRLTGADLMPGGTPEEEVHALAVALVEAGADALNVGIGWHESPVPTVGVLVPRAAFAEIARRLRDALRRAARAVPILAANRINTPEVAERVLAAGAADFVAPARPFLADPEFARKALRGERDRINVCIACNQACLDHVLGRPPEPASCLVNPAAGREEAFRPVPAARPRRVAVVGSGPAGLEAARILGARGHRVTLFEAAPALGGLLRLAAEIPGKGEFRETLRYYEAELAAHGVRVERGHRAEARDLLGAFDAAVVATGVRPWRPDPEELPGVDLPHVVDWAEVLSGRAPVGEAVAVVGGGGIACDLAHWLLGQGAATPEAAAFLAAYGVVGPAEALAATRGRRQITLMRRGPRMAPRLGRTTRWAVLDALRRHGVALLTGVRYRRIAPEGVWIEHEGREVLVRADTVVLATGQRPVRELADALEGRLPVAVVGGARSAEALDAERAIREGAEAALAL